MQLVRQVRVIFGISPKFLSIQFFGIPFRRCKTDKYRYIWCILGESVPYIATGNQYLQETRCFEPISLQVGDNATFYCRVNVTLLCDTVGLRNQTADILWLLNGKRIGKSFERLLIQNVSLHAGVYTCVVRNENWTSNASSVIDYIGNAHFEGVVLRSPLCMEKQCSQSYSTK